MNGVLTKLFLSLSVIFGAIPAAAADVQGLYAKYAILDYNLSTTAEKLDWISSNFKLKVGGNKPSAPMFWVTYYDILGPQSFVEWLKVKDWAAANSVMSEDILMHAKCNYTYSPVSGAYAWTKMDMFDNFEGKNGVLLSADDISFTDVTSTAYSGPVKWENKVYIGYEEPFDQVNIVLSTPGSDVTTTWEYWNGSTWSILATADGTYSLSKSGQVYFVPPGNWARSTINNSRSKYFVRCKVIAGSVYPITSSIKGDNWLNGSNTAVRGWDGKSATIVNSGELSYNPTPPTGATARFRYQARIPYWSSNRFVAHPADFQIIGGENRRTWSSFLAYRTSEMVTGSGYTGIMGDDGGATDNFRGITSTNTDFVDKTTNTWAVENRNKYADLVTAFHALAPTAKIGLNAQTKSLVTLGDWNLAEYHSLVKTTSSLRSITLNDGATTGMCYDDYLPANNPTGKFGLLIYDDTAATVAGGAVVWDRSNRGPLAALTKHLIAANENTYFSYYSRGGYVYNEVDDVVLNDNNVVHLATQPAPVLSTVKRWGPWFPAMAVDVGIPDVNGWNGGVRSFSWRSHTAIGGIQDVWRRDYTNAIVLHRPAMYNTTASEYNTYSADMDLGGTYYPLQADGFTTAGITSIALRTGEGVILMKAPITPQSSTDPQSVDSPQNFRKTSAHK